MPLPALLRPAAALLALLPGCCAAASIGLVTIVDGELAVLRDTQRFAAAEGVRLRADDIVRTGADTKLARIELADGSTLDLGPGTELLLQPQAGGALGERAATLYLARGWLKLGAPASGATAGVASAGLDLQRLAGTAVLRITPEASLLFVESGRAELIERQAGRSARTEVLNDGDAYARRGANTGTLSQRPPAELLTGLPRGFLDSLPRRAARFQSKPVEPGAMSPVRYDEVALWLHAEAPLRPLFVKRFTPRAEDRGFRAGLVAELRAHPEWDRVLFPEKYRPKPVVVVRRAAPAADAASAASVTAAASAPARDPLPVAVNLQGLMTWPGAPRAATPDTTTETR